MGFQILPQAQPRQASLGKRFSNAVGAGLETGGKIMQELNQKNQMQKENETAAKLGLDLSGIVDPKTRQQMIGLALQGINQQKLEGMKEENAKQSQSKLFEHQKELQAQKDLAAGERTKSKPTTAGARSAQPISPEINKKIGDVLLKSEGMSADQLKFAFDEQEIPPADYNQYIENRRRTEEAGTKSKEAKDAQLRAETLPMKKEISDKAQAAQQGIENKNQLLDLIENGDINDPTYAALAEALPLNLGKRLLSNDTVQYKAGLIEEFGDLKNLFKGATRVKEIELLQEKIADLYLTDDQKKAVLKSRINALQRDVIRAEVAAEMESEGVNYPLLTYQQELDKRAKPKLDALFNRILDEHKSVFQDAENKKKIPLNFSDPDDKRIAEELIKESGGDRAKARQLAKKKGYTF